MRWSEIDRYGPPIHVVLLVAFACGIAGTVIGAIDKGIVARCVAFVVGGGIVFGAFQVFDIGLSSGPYWIWMFVGGWMTWGAASPAEETGKTTTEAAKSSE